MVLLTVLVTLAAGVVAVPTPAQAAPSAAAYLAEVRTHTNHERTIREITLGKGGIEIGPPLTHMQGVLTGTPAFYQAPGAVTMNNTPPA